ncbi:accessory Sec system protein Asp2 [Convivina intestini]|uniref:Accessory secretory protein Asp2 n=1 Tax=Convivina intestini TaxID=1505726 RepID=A0A2U1D9D2_9LACO|nr:accessory Sec system protein Asp2 [Convivina intestini]PVY84142.1 accessory secretory protein Asp2 [Convivina intestini]CAH1854429.1 Accessory Sec system protein Asp2 [Convivina intestini]SDB91356.1 accessory secretory protein Asp2 [Leuconostocaceae bacterium R-53105]
MADISVLQIGQADWTSQAATDGLKWVHTTVADLPTFLAQQDEPFKLEQDYVLLTDLTLDSSLLVRKIEEWPAYRFIYLAELSQISVELQQALSMRGAFHFNEQQPQTVAQRILADLYLGQIAFPTRFSEEQFIPTINYDWQFRRSGRFSSAFTGDFGDDWQQIGTLKTFAGDLNPNQDNLIYLDYDATGTAQVSLECVFFHGGRLQQLQFLRGDGLVNMTPLKAPARYQDYQIIVLAKGKGTVDLHAVHQRRSRHGLGMFIPGGQRQLTEDNQEVLSYFNPGTKKGPMIVLFAGTRLHVEGFEMMGPLDKLGYPYLLFTDARSQGGAFDVGNAAYEALVVKIIRKAQQFLGLTSDQVIMSGYSMGSYPAIYYTPDIKPGALLLAKPILNLGTFTSSAEFPHSGVNHDWTLDVRRQLTGRVDPEDTVALNQKLWHKLDQLSATDWPQVSMFSMDSDEYDGVSLPQLLDYLKERRVRLNHHGEPGYHEQKIPEMIRFMIDEYERIIAEMIAKGR